MLVVASHLNMKIEGLNCHLYMCLVLLVSMNVAISKKIKLSRCQKGKFKGKLVSLFVQGLIDHSGGRV